MARALIVGCGCRGRSLARTLKQEGWQVRGTSRSAAGRRAIHADDLEAAEADPLVLASVLDQIEGVALVYWLLGSAQGPSDDVEAVHTSRLDRLLEELIDTPVRAFVYEAAGPVPRRILEAGAEIVASASARWRIPAETVWADPCDHATWLRAMSDSAARLVTGAAQA